MGSIGHVEKLSWDRLGMHSATISVVGASCVSLLLVFGSSTAAAQNPSELRSPSEFSGIQDPQTRSRALFTEAAKVIMNPRCMSCHPASDSPLQGNDQHIHTPPVTRGDNGGGVAGNTCGACHMERNFTLMEKASYQSIPGHPRWGLAPIEMAWEGKSMGEICAQLKDPGRNGGRDLTLLHEHLAKGIQDLGAIPFRERKSGWASSSRRGLIRAPSARSNYSRPHQTDAAGSHR